MATTNEHKPCCSSHGVDMSCERYRRTHFVEVRPCCAADAYELAKEEVDENTIAAIIDDRPQNIQKLEREAGSRKVRYIADLRYVCCNAVVKDGHEVTCENYPMEAS